MTLAVEGSIERGRELLTWGHVLADETSFASWRAARWRWVSRTSRILTLQFESEAVEEFARVNWAAGDTWEECKRGELRAMRDAIELLRSLASTLGG